MFPDAIDLYDKLLEQAREYGPETVAAIKALGREQTETILAEAVKAQMAGTTLVDGKIPRNLVDLVAPSVPIDPRLASRRRDV